LFVRLPSLELANAPSLRLDSAVIGLSVAGTLRARGYDGLLGAEFLRRFRVTFDYPRKRLILRPRVPAPPNLDFDMSGMFIVAEGADLRDLVVADVAPGSAAAVAGIVVGDHLVSIDGRDIRRITLGAVRSLLRGPEGKRVVVEVQRGGERSIARMELARRV
jgi:membrane-associated protease RseP (regulator of RpoE activity)